MPGTQVQQICQCSLEDNESLGQPTHPEVQLLASLGSSGQVPGNVTRDLKRKLKEPPGMCALSSFRVRLKYTALNHRDVQQNVLWPHKFFAMLHKHHRAAFCQRILGGDSRNVARFWQAMADNNPRYPRHSVRSREDHTYRCIPISIHGDGVPVSGLGRTYAKNVYVYTWCSLLGKGNTLDWNFLIWLCYKQYMCTSAPHKTMDTFFKHLRWSLYWLWLGQWPTRDADGQRLPKPREKLLAGGYYALVWVLKGDLEYMYECLGLEYFNSHNPCFCCKANTSTIPWTAHQRNATWTTHLWEQEDWQAHHANCCPLLRLLPGVGVHSLWPDFMHCKHLGTDQRLYGSVLHMLCYPVLGQTMLPGTPQQNLDVVVSKIRDSYKEFAYASLPSYIYIYKNMMVMMMMMVRMMMMVMMMMMNRHDHDHDDNHDDDDDDDHDDHDVDEEEDEQNEDLKKNIQSEKL